jgi:ceramide glucosyltransferase
MNTNAADLVAWLCLGIVIATVLHAAVVAAVVNLRSVEPLRPGGPSDDSLDAITWFRPLKSGVKDLREKLMKFVEALPACDQVLLGVEPQSPDLPTCEAVAAAFPVRVEIVRCGPGLVPNPKISKLMQMTKRARNDRWVIADSEAILDEGFTKAFRTEWVESASSVMTAGYRFIGLESAAQRLDASSTLVTLWPGLEMVRMFDRLRFTLGACTGVRRSDLEKMGGWEVLGNDLAEDRELGRRLSEQGETVGLSRAVLSLESDSMSWLDYWRHQVRVAVTYRVATPAGAAGMILTRGITAGLLLLLVHPGVPALMFLALAIAVRVGLAVRMQRHVAWTIPGLGWIIPVADVVETAAWVVSWFTRHVWWGGKPHGVSWRGKLQESHSASDVVADQVHG